MYCSPGYNTKTPKIMPFAATQQARLACSDKKSCPAHPSSHGKVVFGFASRFELL